MTPPLAIALGCAGLLFCLALAAALWFLQRASSKDVHRHVLARAEAEARADRLSSALDLANAHIDFWRATAQAAEAKLYALLPPLGTGLAPDDVDGRLQRLENLEHDAAPPMSPLPTPRDPPRTLPTDPMPERGTSDTAQKTDSLPPHSSRL